MARLEAVAAAAARNAPPSDLGFATHPDAPCRAIPGPQLVAGQMYLARFERITKNTTVTLVALCTSTGGSNDLVDCGFALYGPMPLSYPVPNVSGIPPQPTGPSIGD